MSKFQQIKEWHDAIKQLSKETNEALGSERIVSYVHSYYKDALSTLLKNEFPNADESVMDDEIADFITLASSHMYKTLVEELTHRYIHANIERINQLMMHTQLSETEFLAKSDDKMQSYYDTEMMIDNLTYKEHPVESFFRFMERNDIQVKISHAEEAVFDFQFAEPLLKKHQNFECNTIHEFLAFCSPILLDQVNKEMLLRIKNYSDVIKTKPHEAFDYDVAKELKNETLYEYLDRFEYIRLHFFLEDLYLLLYYDQIEDFKNQAVMETLKKQLENKG